MPAFFLSAKLLTFGRNLSIPLPDLPFCLPGEIPPLMKRHAKHNRRQAPAARTEAVAPSPAITLLKVKRQRNDILMKDLHELVRIVTRSKLRSVELLSNPDDGKSSKLTEFYQLLEDGRLETDEEAADHFYGKSKDHPAFQKLRSALKDRLINSLFIIDVKQASYADRQKAYYECYRDWAAAKILFGKHARTAALGLCTKILKIARKFEFTELTLDIYRMLRLYYGTIEGEVKKFEQYNEAFKEYEDIWHRENKAEELYIDLSVRFVNSKATKREVHDQALTYFRRLKPLMDLYGTYQFQLCSRLIELVVYSSINDYQQTLEACERAIRFFEKKNYVAGVPLQVAYYQKMICHFQLRQFDEARNTAEKSTELLQPGSFNWFKFRELSLILQLHSQKYAEAYQVFLKTVGHPDFGDLPRNVIETWKIFEAYLKYLILAEMFVPEEVEDLEEVRFRLGRFLNEMSVFSKDKKGMNIPILIIELIYLYLNRDYDAAIDRMEAIDKYRSRYLREDTTLRSNWFVKMLLQLPKNGFNKEKAAEKAASDLAELRKTPIELANQTHEIEIIPYEVLWEIVLENLDG